MVIIAPGLPTSAFVFRFTPAGQIGATRSAFARALRDEVGLTLQPQQAPVEVLVIDNSERPVGN